MSLSIDTRRICAIYALGQWFNIKPGSIQIDAYELCDPAYNPEKKRLSQLDCDIYALGSLYPRQKQGERTHSRAPGDRDCTWFFESPSPHTGIRFKDIETEKWISMSLVEVKAFSELSEVPDEETI